MSVPEIIIKNNKKYCRKEGKPDYLPCIYEGCTKHKQNGLPYCCSHKNGGEKIPKKAIPKREIINEEQIKSIREGYKCEIFVLNILKKCDELEDVKEIGRLCASSDIMYKVRTENFSRGLQVKKLTKSTSRKDTWGVRINHRYPDDMLIVMVNPENNRFALAQQKELPKGGIGLSFRTNKTKYEKLKFDDLGLFTEALYNMCKISRVYEEKDISKNIRQENTFMDRLKEKCVSKKLEYKDTDTHKYDYDIIINNHKCQIKTSSQKGSKNVTQISLGKMNAKTNRRFPYRHDDDIDIFIFGLTKYPDNFCIVPKDVMIDMGFLTTEVLQGKTVIYVSFPDSEKDHWTKPYWDNFDVFLG